MQAGHLLLGRPWQSDRRVHHDGYTNKFSFEYKGKKHILSPLSPAEVYKDQQRLLQQKKEHSQVKPEKDRGTLESSSSGQTEDPTVPLSGNNDTKREGKQVSLYVGHGDVRRALYMQQPVILMMYKDLYFSTTDLDTCLPSSFVSLLQEFEDVFPDELPGGLPPIRGIEHQIDLIPGEPLPNKLAYRSNPEET